jgi:hypothetical protein
MFTWNLLQNSKMQSIQSIKSISSN